MKFIGYKENVSEDLYYGYLLLEDEHFYYICDLLHGKWLQRLSPKVLINPMDCRVLSKNHYEILTDADEPVFKSDWILSLELENEDLDYLFYISQSFTIFIELSDYPLTRRVEKMLLFAEMFMPFRTIQRLVLFLLKEKVDKEERLRFILSDSIHPYLKGHVKKGAF